MITMEIIEMLYLKFVGIWGDRFTAKHNEKIIDIWHEEWLDGLQGLDPSAFRDALKYCKENLEWSPSLAQFIKICDRSLNIPTPLECMQAAIRRDFSHDLTKIIFDKIGSWEMKNSTTPELLKRFEELHYEEMVDFRRKRSLSAQPIKQIEGNSHGSEQSRNNLGGDPLRKATGYLF